MGQLWGLGADLRLGRTGLWHRNCRLNAYRANDVEGPTNYERCKREVKCGSIISFAKAVTPYGYI